MVRGRAQRRWGVRVRVRVGGVRELDELDLAETEGGGEVRRRVEVEGEGGGEARGWR